MASDGWMDVNGSSAVPMMSQSQDQRLISGTDTATVGRARERIFIGLSPYRVSDDDLFGVGRTYTLSGVAIATAAPRSAARSIHSSTAVRMIPQPSATTPLTNRVVPKSGAR
jgi:hypothetical protein